MKCEISRQGELISIIGIKGCHVWFCWSDELSKYKLNLGKLREQLKSFYEQSGNEINDIILVGTRSRIAFVKKMEAVAFAGSVVYHYNALINLYKSVHDRRVIDALCIVGLLVFEQNFRKKSMLHSQDIQELREKFERGLGFGV